MKTERFDEEFRRKLLGLPAEAQPGEVERIQGFINANQPALPGWGWGKLWLYGGSSLLLLGSLSYNVIQTYRNTHLQSSIDSLAHRPLVPAASSYVIRHDTVFITRSGNTIESTSLPGTSSETTPQKPLEQARTNQVTDAQPTGSVAIARPKSPQFIHEGIFSQREVASLSAKSWPTKPATATPSVARNQRSEGSGRSGQLPTEASESEMLLPLFLHAMEVKARQANGQATLPKPEPTGTEVVAGESPTDSFLPETRASSRRSTTNRRASSAKRQPVSGNERYGGLTTNYSRKQHQRTINNPPTPGFSLTNPTNPNTIALEPALNRPLIDAQPLASLKTSTFLNQLAIRSLSRPLVVSASDLSVKATRRSGHLAMPRLSVPNAQYQIGAGFTGGSDQLAGALLGEIRLNRHWSVQAGLQLGYNPGFHYRDEQEFDKQEKADFRQTYAPQVPLSADIEDINQLSLFVQVPIQVAYHYPIGQQWGLRLGLGTNLSVWTQRTVKYSYRENSRSSEHGSSLIVEPTYVLNNFTLSTAVERSWKKWLFRAGPFVSPQLRRTGYKSVNLSWGVNLQLLHRLGK